jgi:hypothetical protein
MWMFCEALYLHRLIVKAFEAPSYMCCFYVFPWVFPCLSMAIYGAFRVIYSNDMCWIEDYGALEWVIYGPNLLALALNLILLFNILRILLTRLQSLPSDSRMHKYRRAVKATLILAPLFGVQFLVIVYRPSHDTSFGRHYELVAALVSNLQGVFVSFVFCLLNAEVIACLKKSVTRFRVKWRRRGGSSSNNSRWRIGVAVRRSSSAMRNVNNTSQLHTETGVVAFPPPSHDRKNSTAASTTTTTSTMRKLSRDSYGGRRTSSSAAASGDSTRSLLPQPPPAPPETVTSLSGGGGGCGCVLMATIDVACGADGDGEGRRPNDDVICNEAVTVTTSFIETDQIRRSSSSNNNNNNR